MTGDARREAMRAELLARTPRWYSPWFHLGFPAAVGLGLIVGAALLVRELEPWQLAAIPALYVVSNAAEWRIHRDVLHRRTPGLAVLYDRQTPEHHVVYVTYDMAMRSTREFRLVLIPAYGILVIFLVNLPAAALLWWLGQRNLACLFIATNLGYVLTYEWLHLAYHAPATTWIGRLGVIRRLRRHHAIHHEPRLMQRWNFNVTVPLWDWVRGTIYRSTSAPQSGTGVDAHVGGGS